ncbi:hypothetical protein HO173_009139 [Letharia columbiana]|uniref:Uncharacterized protein n=1 Tax=Letharia columbiana TaxID=112416 RepID=A0A8H6L256_9LECA|nr:uncharacterized protein HO173_009139 [Letharia columbiana]KAF6232700.1 hypothetical protein HO173_009139 [Letharia columbiana]
MSKQITAGLTPTAGLGQAAAVLSTMGDVPQPSSLLQPDFKRDNSTSTKPKPLAPNTFTGMVDTSDAAVERRYKGTFNALGGTALYNRRLEANLALNREKSGGYAEWNRRRQDAIDRGEDPNADLIAKMDARRPDSYLERAWRKLSGKKKTKAEEKEAKEAKEKKVVEAKARAGNEGDLGTVDVYQGLAGGREDDGIIR